MSVKSPSLKTAHTVNVHPDAASHIFSNFNLFDKPFAFISGSPVCLKGQIFNVA